MTEAQAIETRSLIDQIKASREIYRKALENLESLTDSELRMTLAGTAPTDASASTVARVLGIASASTVDRVLGIASDDTVARVLGIASDDTVARVLGIASDDTVDRMLKALTAAQLRGEVEASDIAEAIHASTAMKQAAANAHLASVAADLLQSLAALAAYVTFDPEGELERHEYDAVMLAIADQIIEAEGGAP